jgi:GT2 family glycosyltransferase
LTISIIIICYNSERFLKKAITSLINQTVKFDRIIVIDNNSSDNSLEILSQYIEVEVIALKENVGYSRGANIGIRHVETDLTLIANSDIILDQEFNAKVISKCQQDKDIGLLSPLILRFDRKTVDSAGQECSRALYPKETGFNQEMKSLPIKEGSVFSVCGAATLFTRKALERLKINDEYYDEDFFIFWEDFDIGWRANLLGLKVHFYPEAIVYHYRSATLKRNFLSRFSLALSRSSNIKYHLVKNRYLTLIKNFRFKKNIRSIPFVFLKDLIWISMLTLSSPKIIIKLLKSGRYIGTALKKRTIINNKR